MLSSVFSLLFLCQLLYTTPLWMTMAHVCLFLLFHSLHCCQCVTACMEQGYKHGCKFRVIPHDWMAQLAQRVSKCMLFRIFLPKSATTILCAYQLPRSCCWTTISVLWLVMANSSGSQKVANEWNTLYQYHQKYCSILLHKIQNHHFNL